MISPLIQIILKALYQPMILNAILPSVRHAHENLHNAQRPGAEFTGWLDLPSRIPDALIKEINALAGEVHKIPIALSPSVSAALIWASAPPSIF